MSSAAKSLVGTAVGEYVLTALISDAKRSSVYRAEHRQLHSQCACKVLHAVAGEADAQLVEEFLATARALSRAHQPSVIDVFDVGALPDGRPYYIMELLDGQRLAARSALQPLAQADIGRIGIGLCGALQAVHGFGLVADSLKSDELFVEERKNQPLQVKLVHVHRGTADVATTITAVGALLKELCARAPDVSQAFAQVIERALTTTAEARFANLQTLAAAIEQATRARSGSSPLRRALTLAMAFGLVVGLPVIGVTAYRLIAQRSAAVGGEQAPVGIYRQAIEVLQVGLRDGDPAVRTQALLALKQAPERRFRERVEPLLDDQDGAVQVLAAQVLGRLGARGTVGALLGHAQAAENSPRDVAFKVACGEALLRLGEANGKQLLLDVMNGDAPAESKLAAAIALEGRGEVTARAFVDRELAQPASPDSTLRILAARAEHADGAAHDRLRTIATANGPLQLAAAQALCAASDASSQPLLRAAFADSKRPVAERQLAASGIGACGDATATMELYAMLARKSEPASLRQAVAGALLRILRVDPQVIAEQNVSFARLALTDDSWTVRESATALLGELLNPENKTASARPEPPPLKEAVQLLAKALADARSEVRLAAIRASGELGARLFALGSAARGSEQDALTALRNGLLRASQGDAAERVVAEAMLARLGVGTPLEKLKQGLAASDPVLRRLAVKEAAANVEIPVAAFVALLDDKDAEVQFTAACALASRGQRQGLKILLAALQTGGAQRERAVRMLALLDEPIPSEMALTPERVREMLSSPAALVRLEAVEALPRLAMANALELLQRAARDVDSAVRWRVAEVAAELSQKPQGMAALTTLRLLADDDDLAVHAHATALLSTLQPEVNAAKAVAKPETPPPPEKPVADAETTSRPTSDGHAKPAEKLAPSQVETLYARGADLLGRKDYHGAFKQLERANQLCARRGDEKATCERLGSDLAYHLGQAYESQSQWSEAMSEYQIVQKRGRSAQQSAAREAISRLAARLGKVVMYQKQKGKCRPIDVWMEPGNHLLKLGDGSRKPVELKAGDVVEIKSCD